MAAAVQVEYKQTFLLGEEDLAKIDELIRKRTDELEDFELEYQVHRLDHALITYTSPAEVTSEQNNLAEAIESLRILGTGEAGRVEVTVSKKRGITLSVYFEDRDKALLLAADLKAYLNSEVLNHWSTKIVNFIQSRDYFFVTVATSLAIGILYIWWSFPALPQFNDNTATDSARLAYLVEVASRRAEVDLIFPTLFAPVILILVGLALGPISKLLFLPSTFYWGKEISRYNRRQSIRNQLFWIVLVGFLISVAASLASGRLTGG